jgi:hypothetical protein
MVFRCVPHISCWEGTIDVDDQWYHSECRRISSPEVFPTLQGAWSLQLASVLRSPTGTSSNNQQVDRS